MQIDFHHAVTYVVARTAGFKHADAEIIAHAAQYVDDATNRGNIHFDNGALYQRTSSAHKMLDYRNFEQLANHKVWIPFHFLPGNEQLEAGKNPNATFIDKIICRPNSYVAQDMLQACLEEKGKPFDLHRLGISMHVYADTWAHQGFAGVTDSVNDVVNVEVDSKGPDEKKQSWTEKVKGFFSDRWDDVAAQFVGDTLPLGHGAVLSYPDLPYLQWRYKNRRNQDILRDNPKDYIDAANCMCQFMQRYLGEADNGLPVSEKKKISELFTEFNYSDGAKRHRAWLEKIAEGVFGFGKQNLAYTAKGHGSWKAQSIGFKQGKVFKYSDQFLHSHWKNFHDGLLAHRFCVLHVILPKYGICAA